MLSFSLRHWMAATVLLPLAGNAAHAQIMYGDPCACPAPVVQPQVCYQQVPVTEYRECRQTVQRPVVETKYVEQPVTEYRPVTETQTCQVPSVQYQTVTECRQVQRDCGRWVTNYVCRPEVAPCEYDPRPDVLGWLNRTGYQVRMAFTPKMYAQRTYVPNVITENIPVQRTVAVPTSRTVAYQVTKMVPYTTTRRVAVNTVRMVAQEVVTRQPVTVMRTVPVGTGVAWGYPYGSSTATALGPTPIPDAISTAVRPRVEASRPTTPTATNSSERLPNRLPPALNEDEDFNGATPIPRRAAPAESRPTGSASLDDSIPLEDNVRISRRQPRAVREEDYLGDADAPVVAISRRSPTAAHMGRWVARRTPRPAATAPTAGPEFPSAIVADRR